MGKLIYSVIGSLDEYIADTAGDFSWAMPDAEVHQYANDELAGIAVHLYGRRTYELMTPWENDPDLAASAPEAAEFARGWQDADKVVYSSALGDGAGQGRAAAQRRATDTGPGQVDQCCASQRPAGRPGSGCAGQQGEARSPQRRRDDRPLAGPVRCRTDPGSQAAALPSGERRHGPAHPARGQTRPDRGRTTAPRRCRRPSRSRVRRGDCGRSGAQAGPRHRAAARR